MHSKFDNIEIMISDKANEIIEKLLNHFLTDIKLQSVTNIMRISKGVLKIPPLPLYNVVNP